MRRYLTWLIGPLAAVLFLGGVGVSLALAATTTPRTVDPPLCQLVPLQAQNNQGGLSTSWILWCGYTTPDGPGPLRLWVKQFVASGLRIPAGQCPKVNPCEIGGVP